MGTGHIWAICDITDFPPFAGLRVSGYPGDPVRGCGCAGGAGGLVDPRPRHAPRLQDLPPRPLRGLQCHTLPTGIRNTNTVQSQVCALMDCKITNTKITDNREI